LPDSVNDLLTTKSCYRGENRAMPLQIYIGPYVSNFAASHLWNVRVR